MISILLPNLNNRPYLEERIESIYRQTTSEWELIIVDSYSEDGAWEFFKDLASRDDRVKASQAPRLGIYAGWNECIRQATGRYVYIATSDDTMAEDCLEKLSAALDRHPECGLAHCNLKFFDENSNEIPNDWWWYDLFAQSSGDYVHRKHIRKAPFDGLLYLSGRSVYISITQLMIRKSLFEKTGLFPTNRGNKGDFQWGMKAGLLTDTIHVPDTWGGWRQHPKQATALSDMKSAGHWQTIEAMSECALNETKESLVTQARKFVDNPAAMLNIRKNRIRAELSSQAAFIQRVKHIANEAKRHPHAVSELILEKFSRKIDLKCMGFSTDWIRFLRTHGQGLQLIPVDDYCPKSAQELQANSQR